MNTQCKESELGKMEKKLNRIRKRIEDKKNPSKLQLEHMLFVVTLKEVKLCALHRLEKVLTTEEFNLIITNVKQLRIKLYDMIAAFH